jgi:ankyrin repeat protein
MEKKYFKVVNSIRGNHGLFYHEGINVDPLPFNPQGDCESGGLYFASEDIFTFFYIGDTVYEVKPIGEIYENPDTPKKWKAHSLEMKLVGKTDDVKTIKFLIENGANIHAKDDDSLYWAAYYGYFDVVKYLVENGANIHACNDAALRYAARCGYLDIVKYLVKHGANVHSFKNEAIQFAADKGYLDIVKILVEHGADIHANNEAALRLAAEQGHIDIVKYLVEHGANIHACDDYAFKNGSKEIVEYLQSLTK